MIDKRALRRLVAEGASLARIARHFGCSKSAVYGATRRLGIRTHGGKGGGQVGRGGPEGHPGWPGSVEYLRTRGAVQAHLLGWPQARTALQARLLSALWHGGPQTLAECLGRKPHPGDYKRLGWLRRRGLIVAERVGRRLLRLRLAPGLVPGRERAG